MTKRTGERRERRENDRLQRSAERKQRKEREQDARVPLSPPKAVGRSKAAAELEEHRRATKKREEARGAARELVGEALKEQRRLKAGEVLTADERQLAEFAKTLSPTKVWGAGFRMV